MDQADWILVMMASSAFAALLGAMAEAALQRRTDRKRYLHRKHRQM